MNQVCKGDSVDNICHVTQTVKADALSHANRYSRCSSRKYAYSPQRRNWKFLRGGGGSQRAQNFKYMCEA